MNRRLEISARSRGLQFEAGVGNAMVARNLMGQSMQLRMTIAPWLSADENLLTILASPLEDAAESPLFEVGIVFPEDLQLPIIRLAWRAREGEDFEAFRVEIPFRPPEVPLTRLWVDAAVLDDLGPDDARNAVAAGMALHVALAGRDLGRTLQLLDYRMREMSIALERELGAHRDAVQSDLAELIAPVDFALVPVDPGEMRVRPCCGGRAFHLVRGDGGELIASVPTAVAREQPMQVYVGKVGSRWIVVR